LVGEPELKPAAANGTKYRLTARGLLMEAANVREWPNSEHLPLCSGGNSWQCEGPLSHVRGSVLVAALRAQ